MKYIKQLDTIRALAVIAVIISHWYYYLPFLKVVNIGNVGVDAFFVLSGFLITKILLNKKNVRPGIALKNFYIRRILRIFPIYYLVIIVFLIFPQYSETKTKEDLVYYLTYTENFRFFQLRHFNGVLGPFWSLAVEEQFYLIWPWLIIFLNKKYFPWLIGAFIFVGMASQYYYRADEKSIILTSNCLDSFGLGALLAWQITYKSVNNERFFKILTLAAGLAVLYFIASVNFHFYGAFRTVFSIISLWVISYIVLYNDRLKFKLILNNPVLIFIGKISYGLYVYHNILSIQFIRGVLHFYINSKLPAQFLADHNIAIQNIENSVLLISIASLSYFLIEKPILKLKERFV